MANYFRNLIYFIAVVIDRLLARNAKNIVILGTKRSGKSTLWKELGGIEEVRANTNWEPVQSFEITRSDGSKVKVSETADIGGEDVLVGDYYGRLIKENTFIYYLVDSNEVSSPLKMRRVRSDLLKIDKVAIEKGIVKKNDKGGKLGFKFILTHFYDYIRENPESNEYDLYRLFLKALEKSKGRGVIGSRLSDDNFKKVIMVAELDEKKAEKLGKDYIEVIKNEIGG